MTWKTAPVYPGAWLYVGDRSYEPGTKTVGLIYDNTVISEEDINRINE